jgi:hypothetical protein
LLAVVTAILASATVLLALYGRKDVVAQERPVVLARSPVSFHQPSGEGSPPQIHLIATNSGRGPALNLEGRILEPPEISGRIVQNPPRLPLPLGVEQRLAWTFDGPLPSPVPSAWMATLTYQDLSDRFYQTIVTFTVGANLRTNSQTQTVRRGRRRYSGRQRPYDYITLLARDGAGKANWPG